MGSSTRVAPLTDSAALARLLRDIDVVLLAAGPFSETALPMAEACLPLGIHYLDLTGECSVIRSPVVSGRCTPEAATAMLMPGCGFEVVASDCLASHVSNRLTGASHLAIGISGLVTATRGSLRTMAEHAGMAIRIRSRRPICVRPARDAQTALRLRTWATAGAPQSRGVMSQPPSTPREYRISRCTSKKPHRPVRCSLAGRAFGPLLQLPLAQRYLKAHAQLFPEGPTATERAVHTCVIVAEASTRDGRISDLTPPRSGGLHHERTNRRSNCGARNSR